MRTNNRPCFPQRLFLLLKLVEDKGLDHIVSWVNDGSAFKVHDLKKFQDELLPKYFSTKKYASFTRQLCAYGFACLRTGRQTGIYSHPGFHRNDPASSFQIKRESVKSVSKTAISNHNSKPSSMKAPAPSTVQPAIPQAAPMTFEFPAVFGNNGRSFSNDHSQLSQLQQLLCAPMTTTTSQDQFMTQQSRPRSHIRSVSSHNMEDAMNGAPDLEPIPVFNWENALLNQKRQNMNQANNMQSFNYVPLSPEIYGETKEFEPQDDMFAPMLEPRYINSMVTPI